MPRRSSARATIPAEFVQPITSSPTNIPPDNLTVLRTHWKWAACSQFFYTFAKLLAMDDLVLEDIENDLAQGANLYLPRIMHRLLYTLSYDRKVSIENWQTALRKQYSRRNPEANPIGPEPPISRQLSVSERDPSEDDDLSAAVSEAGDLPENKFSHKSDKDVDHQHNVNKGRDTTPLDGETGSQTKDWADLPMLEKLDSLHLLVEWQFQNPTRLRTLMKSDDDSASWRIEPIGYDRKHVAYWFIGERLWIQRTVPQPPKVLKRKRNPEPKRAVKNRASAKKRIRLQADRMKTVDSPRATPSTPQRHARAAKSQANLKLDAQAKDLAQFISQSTSRTPSKRGQSTTKETPRSLGTRVSARLRGAPEDEWQPIPDEWLNGSPGPTSSRKNGSTRNGKRPSLKTGLETDTDSISDLTELSDSSEAEEPEESMQTDLDHDERTPSPEPDQVASLPPEGFLEWETICVTLTEWEHAADPFRAATHYTEKSLYKTLTNHIIPEITELLRERERKQKLEDALVHRKRSSRIASKESEKEEARLAARKRAEELEKLSRAQRMEARLRKEEEERVRRETAREQRRREREAKEAARNEDGVRAASESSQVVESRSSSRVPPSTHQIQSNGRLNDRSNGSRTPKGDDWELDCEVCKRRGINLDDGTPMMSCGRCLKWQHITCHDRADDAAGHPRRNWNVVEFLCRACLAQMRSASHTRSHHEQPHNVNNVAPRQNPPVSWNHAPAPAHHQYPPARHVYPIQHQSQPPTAYVPYNLYPSPYVTHQVRQPDLPQLNRYHTQHQPNFPTQSNIPASSAQPMYPNESMRNGVRHSPGHQNLLPEASWGNHYPTETSSLNNIHATTRTQPVGRPSLSDLRSPWPPSNPIPAHAMTTQFRYHPNSYQSPSS